MTIPTNLRRLLGASLLCGAWLTAVADDTVTFQVDLSRYTNSAGAQAASVVDVRGAFNGWGAWTLVNNGANVYTNTYTVTGTTGDKFQYKFTYSTCAGVQWEDDNPPPGAGQPPDEGNNRVLQLVGVTQTLPVVPLYKPSVTVPINLINVNVTYRVDLTEQLALGTYLPGDDVRVTGANPAIGGPNGWGAGVVMTNDPSLTGDATNIYSAVASICGVPGTSGGAFKFRLNSGWEDTATGFDRNFTIIGGNQVLPVYYYEDRPVGAQTNGSVKFQVDMTPQVISGGFTNGSSVVTISGRITGWGNGVTLTNDPSLTGTASNVYSMTIPYASDTVSNWCRFKFRANSGWESAPITFPNNNNNDRVLFYQGGDQVLPLYTYNDASLCDVTLHPTDVTFRVHLPNGRLDNNGIPFDKVNDTVHINGGFLGWLPWDNSLPQMTNNPIGSDFYEITLSVAAGERRVQFKFGLDGPNASHGGLDNENPTFQDHVMYIRNNAAAYTMPMAEFGNQFLSILVEPAFGALVANAPSGGNIPISWLGGPCVTLQSKGSVPAGSWTDHPTTDTASSTNWPNTGGEQYFRLYKRPLP